jgi:DNA-binding NarL/FixJ family response regulator
VTVPKQQSLSDDDCVVVVLVCEGLTNPEIAARLGIGEYVVAVRISYIFRQLGLRNRVQLAVWSVKQGLY